jgi:eukaryotic-like serine/threonine-protein kinase
MSACPNLEELNQLLAGSLEEDTEEQLNAHLEGCTVCQDTLDHLVSRLQPRGLTAETKRRCPSADIPQLTHLKQHPPANFSQLTPGFQRSRQDNGATANGTASAHQPAMPKLPGFEILSELGRGGMGVVYRARQIALNRQVAVKTLLAGAHADAHERARFQIEAEAAAGLHHPNIVQIFEVGEHEGKPFFSMELIEDGTLKDRLLGRPQPPRESAALAQTLACAVQYAHECSIVHRDLKPANILLQVDSGETLTFGTPKIADFGLAKILSGEMRHTRTSMLLGTPEYMAPEQTAASAEPVGPACDIYALGVLLYEMLTGRPPFTSALAVETLQLVRAGEPLSIARLQPRVPRDLQIIAHKCLQKDPSRRYASARALAEDLQRFLDHRPIAARPPSIFYQWRQLTLRHKGLVSATLAVLAALTAGAVASVLFALGEAKQRRVADENARHADEAWRLAERQTYQARIAGAQMAVSLGDYEEAVRQLRNAPELLRGWEWRHLDARCREQMPLRTPLDERYGEDPLGFFPVVPEVFVHKRGGPRSLVDGRTGHLLRQWSAEGYPVSLRGETLVGLSSPGKALTCTDAEGRVVFIGPILDAPAQRLIFSKDGVHLAVLVAAGPKRIRLELYEAMTARLLWQSSGAEFTGGPIFSPDGACVAAGDADGTIRIWQTASGVLSELKGHAAAVMCLAFSPDGRQLASASNDEPTRQWDLRSGRPLLVRNASYAVAFSPDGRWLATANHDRTVTLWSVENKEPAVILRPNGAGIWHLGFSPDGLTLGMIDAERKVFLVPAPEKSEVGVLRGHSSYVYSVAYSPDGTWIASAGWDQVVRLWDTRTGEQIASLPAALDAYIGAMVVAPDGRYVAAWAGTKQIWLWDIATGVQRPIMTVPGLDSEFGLSHTLAISPDGRWLAVGERSEVRRFDRELDQEGPPFAVNVGRVRHVAFSPDGNSLAAAGEQGLCLMEADTGHVRWETQPTCRSLAFSADGRRLVAAGADDLLRIWSTADGKLERTLSGHTGEIFTAVFHPNGNRLASGGRDQAVHIWDTDTGDLMARLPGHTSYIFSLAFSPDGQSLVSGSGDHTLRLWNTQPLAEGLRARKK